MSWQEPDLGVARPIGIAASFLRHGPASAAHIMPGVVRGRDDRGPRAQAVSLLCRHYRMASPSTVSEPACKGTIGLDWPPRL